MFILIIVAIVIFLICRSKKKRPQQVDLYAPELITPQGMADTCIVNGFSNIKYKGYLTNCFTTIVQNLAPGEVINYVFTGLFDYRSYTKHAGLTIFAVTNYRIMIARMDGKAQKFLQTELKRPPTMVKEKLFGIISIEVARQAVPIGADTEVWHLSSPLFNDDNRRSHHSDSAYFLPHDIRERVPNIRGDLHAVFI